ncbi:MAG: type III pantothenate kinase [Candidatus Marinimicrobia bacterium]|nr:type III pantothenate kinase [Candidatus Neomarinimicrobiota bacterium]
MILAIDIGNTNVVLGLFKDSEIIESWRFTTDSTRTIDECWVSLKLLAQDADRDLDEINEIVIGSVVPKETFVFKKMCNHYLNITPFEVNGSTNLGIKLDVSSPEEVGPDRIANVYAAGKLYGKPAVVVDFGTATTYDVIDEKGSFIGGAIAPGIETSAIHLFQNAALLHRIDFEIPNSAIGKDTRTNLESGILFGAADQVDGMIKRIKDEKGWNDIPVIVTGGLGKVIGGIAKTKITFDDDLTLKGLFHIFNDLK